MLSSRFKAILKGFGINLDVNKTVDIGTKEEVVLITYANMIRLNNYGKERGWM